MTLQIERCTAVFLLATLASPVWVRGGLMQTVIIQPRYMYDIMSVEIVLCL